MQTRLQLLNNVCYAESFFPPKIFIFNACVRYLFKYGHELWSMTLQIYTSAECHLTIQSMTRYWKRFNYPKELQSCQILWYRRPLNTIFKLENCINIRESKSDRTRNRTQISLTKTTNKRVYFSLCKVNHHLFTNIITKE